MYGNAPVGTVDTNHSLSPDERKTLRRDLASVAARTRDFLPSEFAVGSEITDGSNGPRATVAVQPPIGPIVSAGYTPQGDSDLRITDEEREDLAIGLAASAALQVKEAVPDDEVATAG